jgi:hypothetical protein
MGFLNYILEILNLTTRCIPMDILAWTDCVRSSAGNISYIDIFTAILLNSWTTPRDQNRHEFCYSMFLNERSMSIIYCVYASISFMGCWLVLNREYFWTRWKRGKVLYVYSKHNNRKARSRMHESECYFFLHLLHQNSCLVFVKKTIALFSQVE